MQITRIGISIAMMLTLSTYASPPPPSLAALDAGIANSENIIRTSQSSELRFNTTLTLAELYSIKGKYYNQPEFTAKSEKTLRDLTAISDGKQKLKAMDAYGTSLVARGRFDEALANYEALEQLMAQISALKRSESAQYLSKVGVAFGRAGREADALDRFRRSIRLAPSLGMACAEATEMVSNTDDRDVALKFVDHLIDDKLLACAEDVLHETLESEDWRDDSAHYVQLLTTWVRYLADARVSPDDYRTDWRIEAPADCSRCKERITSVNFAMTGDIFEVIATPAEADQHAKGWLTSGYARAQFARLAAVAAKQYANTSGRDIAAFRLTWAWNLRRRALPTAVDLLEILNEYPTTPPWAMQVIADIRTSPMEDDADDDESPLLPVRFHNALGRALARSTISEGPPSIALDEWQKAAEAYELLDSETRRKNPMPDLQARLAAAEASAGCMKEAQRHYGEAIRAYAAMTRWVEARSLLSRLELLPCDDPAELLALRTLIVHDGADSTSDSERLLAYIRAWIAADPRFRKATIDVHSAGNGVIVSGQIDTASSFHELQQSVALIPGIQRISWQMKVASAPIQQP